LLHIDLGQRKGKGSQGVGFFLFHSEAFLAIQPSSKEEADLIYNLHQFIGLFAFQLLSSFFFKNNYVQFSVDGKCVFSLTVSSCS
jgi:hypothetical protein